VNQLVKKKIDNVKMRHGTYVQRRPLVKFCDVKLYKTLFGDSVLLFTYGRTDG